MYYRVTLRQTRENYFYLSEDELATLLTTHEEDRFEVLERLRSERDPHPQLQMTGKFVDVKPNASYEAPGRYLGVKAIIDIIEVRKA